MVSTAETYNEDERESSQSDDNPQSSLRVHQLTITSDHPYAFHFDRVLADKQRSQFESEMLRKNGSKYDMIFIFNLHNLFFIILKNNTCRFSTSSTKQTRCTFQ
jgi:hypothetical protein